MPDETTTAVATRDMSVLAQIDALDEQLVIASLSGGLAETTEKWVYRFPQGGQQIVGLSIDGVQEAARHLATKGEAIEQVWVKMEDQNEREAFFLACAVRYAVAPDGTRVELDRAIRAKRQPKFTTLTANVAQRKGVSEELNPFWYEIGVAKCMRNAVEALLPEAIKQHMIKFAGKSEKATPAPRAAAERSHSTAAPAGAKSKPATKHPKQEAVELLTEAKRRGGEWWAKLLRLLMQEYPDEFSADGALLLSDATDERAAMIRDVITKALEMAPEAQAEMV